MSEKSNEVAVVEENALSSDTENNVVTHNMYDYFKQHPSLFITIISTFAAIMSVFLNMIAFFSGNAYLKYFNVDSIFYKKSNQFIYFFAIALVFFVIVGIFQGFITKTFDSYLPHKRIFLLCKYSLRSIKKNQIGIKRKHKKIQHHLLKHSKLLRENDEKKEDLKVLEDLKKDLKKMHDDYIKISKKTRKMRVACFLVIGMSCLVTWIVLFVVFALMLSIATYDWKAAAVTSLFFSSVYVLMCAVENWFLSCAIHTKRKSIKYDVDLDLKSQIAKYGNFDEFPISALFDGNIKPIFNDFNLKRLISAVLLCLVLLIFLSIYGGSQSAYNQKEFFVVDIENQTYVMIYNNGENMILEKSEITENGIIIDTNHQKMISTQNVDMKKYIFEKVDVIRTEHTFSKESTNNQETTNNIGGN